VDENSIAYASAKRAANNASSKDRPIKQGVLEIAKDASKKSEAQLNIANAKLANNVQATPTIKAEITKLRTERRGYIKEINDIETAARNAKKAALAKAKADAEAKAKTAAPAATSGTNQVNRQLNKKNKEEKAALRVAKAATAATKANPFKRRNRFALLSENDNDNDMDYENNGIDFLEPPNLACTRWPHFIKSEPEPQVGSQASSPSFMSMISAINAETSGGV